MTEEKKQSEEKKYSQIWREFVVHCGDAVGCSPPLSPEIAALLAEDATYRLREAVQNAGQFMRHAKRKKLTNGDFNNALRWSDVEPVYGYSSQDPMPFINVKEAEVFCPEDHEINLVLMATGTHVYEHPGVSSLKAQWLAIEGIQKPDSAATTATTIATAKKNGAAAVVPTVSDNLMAYYKQVTKAILGNNSEVTKMALNDLRTNPKISTLVPFFINFVCVGVKKVSHDLTQLTKLLHTVRSITDNRYLYLGPRPLLKLLVQGVMYCIVEPLAASLNPINDHWALRDYAARLLANIVRLWNTPVNQLYQSTVETLQEIFRDLTKPFCSHYGAVIAIMALGIEPVQTCVYPNIARYWTHLMTTLEDSSLSNVPFKSDANKVYGALLLASEFLMLHEHRELSGRQSVDGKARPTDETPIPLRIEPCKTTALKSEPGNSSKQLGSNTRPKPFGVETAYDKLYDFFGDALAARLPYVHVEGLYVAKLPKLMNLFTTPELMQTGEELLESFNVKEEDVQSNSMEDDRYSYDDNSPMSDDVEVEPVDVDLRIKSTVSDPTLGIKLTIAKLPRALPPPTPVEQPAKVKKLSIKISKEQIKHPDQSTTQMQEREDEIGRPVTPKGPFEVVVMKRSSMYIEFNFDGSMPIPRDQLKRQRIETHPFCTVTGAVEVHRINSRMKTVGKLRTKSVSLNSYERFVKMFRMQDITAII